ncbi:MAG: hypothetical protein R3Y32_02410 [Bacillota bacterium]
MPDDKLNKNKSPEPNKKGKKAKGEKPPKQPKEKLTKEQKAQRKAEFADYEQNKNDKAKARIEYAYKSNDMYSYVRNHNRVRKWKYAVMFLLVACTAFYSAIILVYWFDAGGGSPVVVPEHEHTYDYSVSEYHNGNCQEYGYTLYYCEVEYCDAFEKIYDKEIGNHQYETTPETVVSGGVTYYVYECEICGAINTLTTLLP